MKNKPFYFLDASPRYNHGCSDSATLKNNFDGTCTVVSTVNCHHNWQSGHNQDHEYMTIGEILTIDEVLNHCDLMLDEEIIII